MVQGQGTPRFPAILVLGDSTLDAGNNNRINTPAKCNFPPYGRDFPGHVPTGRFSNGMLASDFLASSLGIKELVPAYLDPQLTSNDLVTGVTFASAGSGYDNATAESGNVISFDQQINYLREYQLRLRSIVGQVEASRIISDSLYYIATGNADFGVSYFNFNPRNLRLNRATQFTISQYVDFLISQGARYIQELYNLGARKMLVAGLSILGCSPSERTYLAFAGRPCNERINEASYEFNQKWEPTLANLQASLPGSTIVYSDIYTIAVQAVQNPLYYGFQEVTRGCCGTGLAEVGQQCRQAARLSCPDADKFIYWDSVHPTQRMYRIIADLVMERDIPALLN